MFEFGLGFELLNFLKEVFSNEFNKSSSFIGLGIFRRMFFDFFISRCVFLLFGEE